MQPEVLKDYKIEKVYWICKLKYGATRKKFTVFRGKRDLSSKFVWFGYTILEKLPLGPLSDNVAAHTIPFASSSTGRPP